MTREWERLARLLRGYLYASLDEDTYVYEVGTIHKTYDIGLGSHDFR
jgi:hypothetical protein